MCIAHIKNSSLHCEKFKCYCQGIDKQCIFEGDKVSDVIREDEQVFSLLSSYLEDTCLI